jgi:hypothetical protein
MEQKLNPIRLQIELGSTLSHFPNETVNIRLKHDGLERIQNYSPEACADGLAAAAISAGTEAR